MGESRSDSMNKCLVRAGEGKNPPRWPEGTVTDKCIKFWNFELNFVPLHWLNANYWTLLGLDWESRKWSHLDPMGSMIPKAKCRSAKGLVERFSVKSAKGGSMLMMVLGFLYRE